MNKKNSIDSVSIVMIIIFAVLVAGGLSLIVLGSYFSKNAVNNDGVTSVNLEEIETEEVYETYEELADKFIELCEFGDTESMYSLYYDDLLTKRCEKLGRSKEEYDALMKENMLHITGFEEYRYGEGELIMGSAADYVNQIYLKANEELFPYTDVVIDDCVDLRAYFENGAFIDFMLARIDGYWYMVV